MIYTFTDPSEHIDYGFGITAETYYDTAEILLNQKSTLGVNQIEMPINFLYRHSIELFLKSLIIIFHSKLKIKYENDSPDSKQPKIFSNNKWRPLYKCHWLDELYKYWREHLLLPNIEQLNKVAPKGDWQDYEDIVIAIEILSKYDRESSFFRYPVTENTTLDLKKFTMRRAELETLIHLFEDKNDEDTENINKYIPRKVLLVTNENDSILKAYANQINPLEEVTIALKKTAHYLFCYHVMSRMTLCLDK